MEQMIESQTNRTAAIVLAAGQGKRMHAKVAKQYLLLKDKPVLYYALNTFEKSFVDEIVLVTGAGEEEYCRKEIVERYGFHKVTKIVAGGKERYHSVYQGLLALTKADVVMIHDGARPFVTDEMLKRAYDAVLEMGACVVGVPVIDTIKIVDDKGYVESTPDRSRLYSIQTPQAFRYPLIRSAYDKLMSREQQLLTEGVRITDDAMVAETILGCPVKIVEGSYDNIKITTPGDLARAASLVPEE